MMKLISLVVSGISLFAFLGCSQDEKKEKTNVVADARGEWQGERRYVNDYFGFALDLDDKWHIEKSVGEDFVDEATSALAGDEKDLQKVYESAIEKTFFAFAASLYPSDIQDRPNPNLNIVIENVKVVPTIKQSSDYLLAMEESLKLSQIEAEFDGEPVPVTLGGVDFSMRASSMTMGPMTFLQKSYARKEGDYVILITTSFLPDDGREELEELIGAIQKTGE